MFIKRILLSILLVFTLQFCSKKEGESKTGLLSHLVSITENEDKGIKEILAFFGGQCQYFVGVVKSTEDQNDKKYFKLQLSKSFALSKYADKPQLITSGLAYIFYRNLSETERNNYTHIRGVLLNDDGSLIEHEYTVSELRIVDKRMATVMSVFEVLKAKKFEELKTYLNPQTLFTYEKEELIKSLQEVDPQFGNAQEFRFFGFENIQAENRNILTIFGMMIRDVQSNELKIYLDPESDNNEIFLLDYRW